MKYFFLFLLLISGLLHAERITVRLGDSKVTILKQAGHGKTLIHLHQNEVTALKAAKLYIKKHGGTLISLKQRGKRNIVFYLKNVRYEFDPNRIFTNAGITKTLKHHGPYSREAHQEVRKLARAILCLLPTGKIISLHNNRGTYSLKEYFPQQPLAKDARALNHIPNSSYRNFCFVTQRRDFNRLKNLRHNVALQAYRAEDDGSLSYYLGRKIYINVEAAYGALRKQLEMIKHA